MANLARYAGVSDGIGPSPIVWDEIPKLEIEARPSTGFGFYDQFGGALVDHTGGTTCKGWVVDYIANAGDINPAEAFGGGIIILPAGAEDDGMQLQKPEAWEPLAGYSIAMGAKVTFSDADQTDFFLGLSTVDADILGSNPNDMIGFIVADGSATLNYIIRKDGSGSATTTGETLTNTTFKLEVLITGKGNAKFYVDGVLVIESTSSNIESEEEMGFAIAHLLGATAADSVTVNWAYCYQWVDAK